MAHISRYPFVRHIRADATSHIQYFKDGKRIRSGRGLSFWFLAQGASISEVPLDDRELPFLVKGQSADYQDLTAQGAIVWRVKDPEVLGDRVDFTIGLANGRHTGLPIDQINNVLTGLAGQATAGYLKQLGVRNVLEQGAAPLRDALLAGIAKNAVLGDMGIEIIGINVADVAPSRELARALQAPTFESLQQQADEATFARRALAVEKERAIAENELGNRIELAAQQQELIAREDANTRAEAKAKAAAMHISTDAEAARIRTVDQARVDMESARMNIYADLPPTVLMAMAAQEFAGKLDRIDNLTVTPDMLSSLMTQMRQVMAMDAVTPATTERKAQ